MTWAIMTSPACTLAGGARLSAPALVTPPVDTDLKPRAGLRVSVVKVFEATHGASSNRAIAGRGRDRDQPDAERDGRQGACPGPCDVAAAVVHLP